MEVSNLSKSKTFFLFTNSPISSHGIASVKRRMLSSAIITGMHPKTMASTSLGLHGAQPNDIGRIWHVACPYNRLLGDQLRCQSGLFFKFHTSIRSKRQLKRKQCIIEHGIQFHKDKSNGLERILMQF